MNRRDFLKSLGIGAASLAAPKIIFDMGKNSRIYCYKTPFVCFPDNQPIELLYGGVRRASYTQALKELEAIYARHNQHIIELNALGSNWKIN